MKSVISLSHTSKELYLKSPRAYFYHYHLYLRDEKLKSVFFFGSLIETGLEALLKGATLEQALDVFRKNFKTYTVNGSIVDLSNSKYIRYTKADLDMDVFNDKEKADLQNKPVQFQTWASLQRKGEMLITAYAQEIRPKIKKVIALQESFTLPNGIGDEINGKVDAILEWEDGRLIVPDHKTTSVKYKEDSIKTEEYGKQTAVYYDALKPKYPLDGAAFFVMEKKIRKNEPRVRTSVIIDVPPEGLIQKTFDEFDIVLSNIKEGNFDCKSPNCDAYGESCCYKKYCKSGGKDMTGLVKIGKK